MKKNNNKSEKIFTIVSILISIILVTAFYTKEYIEDKQVETRFEENKNNPYISIQKTNGEIESKRVPVANRYEEEVTNEDGETYTQIIIITTDGTTYRSIYWTEGSYDKEWNSSTLPHCVYEEVK